MEILIMRKWLRFELWYRQSGLFGLAFAALIFATPAAAQPHVSSGSNYSSSPVLHGDGVRKWAPRVLAAEDLRMGNGFKGGGHVFAENVKNEEIPGQCDEGWQAGAPVNGVDGWTRTIAVDGAGNVYVGGTFGAAGNTLVNNIAKWDGTTWSSLGTGLNGSVAGIAISGTDVYVGGSFTTAGGIAANGVAKWNGSVWSPVGSGPGHSVEDLAISASGIYVGGSAAAPDYKGVVSFWNGSTWAILGTQFEGGITDVAVSGSNIFASRQFARGIFKWSGSTWIDISPGSNVSAVDLAASGPDLYIAGYQYMGPTQGEAGYVARWNGGTWTILASEFGSDRFTYVDAVAVSGTDVYIAGLFSIVGGVPANGTAKWNGSTWSALGNWHPVTGYTIAVSGNDAYFGSRFVSNAGLERRAEGIAKWNGSSWSDLGQGIYTVPNVMATSGADVYAAGYFTTDGGNSVDRLVKWNGSGWQPVTSSFPTGPAGWPLTLRALAVSGSDFYIGGYRTTPDKQSWAGFVYKWNGSAWSELGTGMNGQVTAVVISGAEVYAGGRFTVAGGVAANRIARWKGSAWQPLGSGLDGGVTALNLSGNILYAGGYFTSGGGVPADKIASWDGVNWSSLADGPMLALAPNAPQTQFRAVTSIVVSGTDIYAGGGWDLSDYQDIGFVSKWNGSQWSQILGCCGFVNTLVSTGDGLYAGKDGWADDGVSKWSGSTWLKVGFANKNASGSVGTIAIRGQEIFVGSGFNLGWEYTFASGEFEGGFSTAGCHVSANFAKYSAPTLSLSGRVLSPGGQGLRNTLVTISDAEGSKRSTLTSTLGYYSFGGILGGATVFLSASSRRYRFQSITRTMNENLSEINLVGLE
jgi:hypothetical protein